MSLVLVLAQLRIERHADSCVSRDGVCPGWIADNLDRYKKPLIEHIELTLIAVVIGFAIAFSLALLAHESQYGPVVDGEGRVVGVLSIELLSHMIATEESA